MLLLLGAAALRAAQGRPSWSYMMPRQATCPRSSPSRESAVWVYWLRADVMVQQQSEWSSIS